MINDPDVLAADGGDRIGPGNASDVGTGDVGSDFKMAVLDALRAKGVDILRLSPDQLDTLIVQLWNTQRLQDLYQLQQDPEGVGFPDVTVTPAELRKAVSAELFDPTVSSSSQTVQTGLNILEQQKLPLTDAQQQYLGSSGGRVPAPFQGMYPITEDHSEGDPGIDYGTPVGTSIYTPFAGTIHLEDSGKGNWGKRVLVTLDNGYTFGAGHLTMFSVADGQRVDPGELIGLSGGDPSDPSSGVTTGPHVELQWIAPDGSFQDPHAILDPIFRGSSFRSLNMATAAGVSSADTSELLSKYPEAVSAFKKYVGRRPTAQELMPLIGMTSDQLTQYFRTRNSHIPGLTFGAYDDLRRTADSESNNLFGHGVTDGMLKELSDQGKTSPTAVRFWLTQMDIQGKMDPKTYQSLYQLNQPHMAGIYNQPKNFDPRIALNQKQQMQDQGIELEGH